MDGESLSFVTRNFPCFSYWMTVFREALLRAWEHLGRWFTIAGIASFLSIIAFIAEWLRKSGADVNWWLIAIPVFVGMAAFVVALVTVPYQMHAKNQKAIADWQELYRPKIEVECGSLVPGSKVTDASTGDFDSVYRLVLRNAGLYQLNLARAVLTEIVEGETTIWGGDQMSLVFSHAGNYVTNLQLDPNLPAYLEVVGIKDGKLRIASNKAGRGLTAKADNQIQNPAEYLIKIAISATSCPPLGLDLLLKWTGHFSDSTLEIFRQSPLLRLPPS